MVGGLFVIDRMYFYEIGLYDIEMFYWGGENVEMFFWVSLVYFDQYGNFFYDKRKKINRENFNDYFGLKCCVRGVVIQWLLCRVLEVWVFYYVLLSIVFGQDILFFVVVFCLGV